LARSPQPPSGRAADREDEFARFVAEVEPRARATAWRMLGSVADAEDAVQDAFVRAWRGLRDFRRDAKLGTWFYRILVSACLDAGRRRTARRKEQPRDEMPDAAATGESPDVLAARSDECRRVRAAMESLSDQQRQVFLLRHHEGLGVAEIADVLGIAEGTAKSHLARAVLSLRAQLVRSEAER
jgi:RNA polymerase sigma-70 factor (ECF subfamily)